MSRFQEHFNSSQHTLSSTSSESSLLTSSSLGLSLSSTNHSNHHHQHVLSSFINEEELKIKKKPTLPLGRFSAFKKKSKSVADLDDIRYLEYQEKCNPSYFKFVDRIGTFYQGIKRKSSTHSH